MLGHRRAAGLVIAAAVWLLGGGIWLAWLPSTAAVWTFLGGVLAASGASLWEFSAASKLPILGTPPESRRGFFLAAAVFYAGVAAMMIVMLANLALIYVRSDEMSPTVRTGDVVLVSRSVASRDVQRGCVILCRESADSAYTSRPLILRRVLAMPGDTLSLDGEMYLVNGKPKVKASPPGDKLPVLQIPHTPESVTVPEGCYFVISDNAAEGPDSRVLNWIREGRIVSARLVFLSLGRFGRPVE